MSVEAELKFRVSLRKLSSLAKAELAGARRGAPSEQDRVSTYFDANKHKLKRNGFIKRRRLKNWLERASATEDRPLRQSTPGTMRGRRE